MTWDLEAGPAARQTRFDDGRNENSLAFRGASRFGWDISEATRFTNDTFLFVETASSINNTAAISTTLFENFVAGLSFTYLWEEEPAPGLKSSSTITRFTLGYAF
jgi:putative salt-induced outer membrane protein YdiY